MFRFVYKYRLKTLIRSKILIFWTLAFPVVMGLFYYAAFSKIDTVNQIENIKVAIVTDDSQSEKSTTFQSVLEKSQYDGKNIFSIEKLSATEAKDKLQKNEIAGYYSLVNDKITLNVVQQEYPQIFLVTFLDQFEQITHEITTIASENPQLLSNELMTELATQNDYLKTVQKNKGTMSIQSYMFFALIGMSCMFGLHWGLKNTSDIQANQTVVGIRASLSPIKKLKTVTAYFLAAITIFMVEIAIFLSFYHFVLGVDFGNRWQYVLLVCFVAAFVAVSMGMFLGNILRVSQSQKVSIGISIQVCFSILAGMMGPDPKYYIDQYAPILGYLNPVNLISDSLYKFYYYTDYQSAFVNIACMLVMVIIFLTASILFERNEQYAHL